MTSRDTAIAYLERFCAGDIAALWPLFAADLQFHGPRLHCTSAEAYLEALWADPPQPTRHALTGIVAEGNAVALFYELAKEGHTLAVAQLLRFEDERIASIDTVFDSGAGPQPERAMRGVDL